MVEVGTSAEAVVCVVDLKRSQHSVSRVCITEVIGGVVCECSTFHIKCEPRVRVAIHGGGIGSGDRAGYINFYGELYCFYVEGTEEKTIKATESTQFFGLCTLLSEITKPAFPVFPYPVVH